MKATAVFLDRDGTIIEDRNYLSNPEEVRLLPGAAEAIRRFSATGYLVVVVSNQSGIARGRFDEPALANVHARMEALLKEQGAYLDATYYCPYLDGPEARVEAYRRRSDQRKPEPGMLLQAAEDLNIDLVRSWLIGDAPRDVEAGLRAGCRTILLDLAGAVGNRGDLRATHVAGSLLEAADYVERDMKPDDQQSSDTPNASRDDQIVRLLGRIHDQLDRLQRRERQYDFSVLRLFGALLQMFAIVAAIWGLTALLGEQSAVATARLTLACFLQLAAISGFAIDRFR